MNREIAIHACTHTPSICIVLTQSAHSYGRKDIRTVLGTWKDAMVSNLRLSEPNGKERALENLL